MIVRFIRPSLLNLPLAFVAIALAVHSARNCVAETSSAPTLSASPHDVFVARQDVYCRCGPGEAYYRTDPVRHGQQLTVYAETADGWLGIRPPQRSFDWIQSSVVAVDPTGETGRVTEDRSVAWIGTSLGRAKRFRWQVQLAEDESVTIIGRSMRDGPDGPQEWFKIVPPSGEFRWLHRDDVVESSEELLRVAGATTASELTEVDVAASDTPNPNRRRTEATHGRSILQSSHVEAKSAPTSEHLDRSSGATDAAPLELTGRPARLVDRPKHRQTYQASLGDPQVGAAVTSPATNDRPSEEGWIASTIRKLSGANDGTTESGRSKDAEHPMAFQTSRPEGPAMTASPPLAANDLAADAVGSQTWSRGPRMVPLTETASTGSASPSAPTPSAIELADTASRVFEMDSASSRRWLSELMIDRGPAEFAEILVRHAQKQAIVQQDPEWSVIAEQGRRYAEVARRRDGHAESAWMESPSVPMPNHPRTQSTWSETSPIAPEPSVDSEPSIASVSAPAVSLGTPSPANFSSPTATGTGDRIDPPDFASNSPPGSRVVATSWQDPEGRESASMTGQLVELYSARPGSPPFALVDSTGTTLCYVSPIPGVNLRRHVNSRVQVEGSVGYLAGISTPLLRANQAMRR